MLDKSEVIKEWIRENRNSLVTLTQELVQIPSITGHEFNVQEYILKRLDRLGLEPRMVLPDVDVLGKDADFFETSSFVKYGYENRPNVAGILKGSGNGRSICLSGHVDVVSPEPIDQWSYDPWSGEVNDGMIYGRGAGDMKAGIAAMIIAVEAIRETNVKLKGDVHLETTIEEEDGGVGGNLYMRLTQPRTDGAINPEPTSLQIGMASAGVMYFRVISFGVPAHAATAHFGVNAIHKMIPIIEALRTLNERRQQRISYAYAEAMSPRMKGRVTTINIGVVRAGDWPSTVPGACEIECRIGWPPGETREEVMREVEQCITNAYRKDSWLRDHPPKVEWFGWRARPHEQDVQNPFVICIRDQIAKATKKNPVLYGGSAGLDTRFFVNHGTPAVTFGPAAQRIHSFDECVSIESIVTTAEVIAATTMDWCGVA